MRTYKEIPISSAKEIATKYEKDEVIILSIDRKFNKVIITTYGNDKEACKRAEATSEFLAEIFQLKNAEIFFDLIENIKTKYLEKRNN